MNREGFEWTSLVATRNMMISMVKRQKFFKTITFQSWWPLLFYLPVDALIKDNEMAIFVLLLFAYWGLLSWFAKKIEKKFLKMINEHSLAISYGGAQILMVCLMSLFLREGIEFHVFPRVVMIFIIHSFIWLLNQKTVSE